MVKIFHRLSELDFGKLMLVYEEGNRENAQEQYPELDDREGLLEAEQDFYCYLREIFFRTSKAYYAVWEENGRYISALRMEPYQDGWLLAALETMPECRRKGYAVGLIRETLERVREPVYSHVGKKNEASLRAHLSCGFEKLTEYAVYLDGSVNDRAYTLCRKSY